MVTRARTAAPRPRALQCCTPAGIASVAVGLGAAVSTDCLLQPFFDGSVVQRAVGAVVAASFGVSGTRWALSHDPAAWSALRACAGTGSVVLSWFVLYDQVARLQCCGHIHPWASLILPVLMVVIAVLGAIVGTLFGLTTLVVVRPVERAQTRPSLDALERVLLPTSLWLCAWGLVFVAIHHPRSLPPLALVLVGLGGLGTVLIRDIRRLAWLLALHRGALPGWSLSPLEPLFRSSPLPVFGPCRERDLDGQLAPVAAGRGPYRSTSPGQPVARLPLNARAGIGPVRRRIAWTAALLLAVAVGLSARLDVSRLAW